ncbi:MAG: TorF family putative porin [Gallionella sp.]
MFKNKILNSFILAALAVPSVAMAADAPASPHTVTANVGLVSDYVWRGISQTSHKPAIQGGFDYAHASGFYAGVWGSNISWISDTGGMNGTGSASLELDTYFGFRNSFADDFTYDVGFIRYNYPGSYNPAASSVAAVPGNVAKADTDEIYGAIGYKWVTLKYSYGLGAFLTIPGAQGTNYLDLTASYPIADSGFTVAAHVGKQTYKGTYAAGLAAFTAGAAALGTPTYTDYKLGVTKDISGYVLGLAYTSTNASSFYTASVGSATGKKLGQGTTALSLTHAF